MELNRAGRRYERESDDSLKLLELEDDLQERFPSEPTDKPQHKSCFFNKKPQEKKSPTRAAIEDDGW